MLSLNICELTHYFGMNRILNNINFISKGNCIAITGENGAGKSTLMKITAGLLLPTYGMASLCIDGDNISNNERRNLIGMAAPYINLYDELTVQENLQLLLDMRAYRNAQKRIVEVLADTDISQYSNKLFSELSTGQRQRVKIAAAIVHKPVFLLLDEPTVNLDDNGIEIVDCLIKKQSKLGIVVIATNKNSEADLAQEKINLGKYDCICQK